MMHTKNFFAPLRDLEMEEAPETGSEENGSGTSQQSGKDRPPPIIITAAINLKFQVEIKAIVRVALNFEILRMEPG